MSENMANNILDKVTFEALFKSHFVHLCNFAVQFVGDMDTARDITQKIFIHLWENRAQMDPNKAIRSYLFTSVKNRCLNHIRDRKKYRSRILDVNIHEVDIAFEEDQMAVDELQKRIDLALNKLPEKCRQVFELSRYENKKYQEIADKLNISKKTVEAHMSRALRSLREDLGDYLYILLLFGTNYFC